MKSQVKINLQLKKETITELNTIQLNNIAGGSFSLEEIGTLSTGETTTSSFFLYNTLI